MKKEFINAEIEIINLESQDIVTTSGSFKEVGWEDLTGSNEF